MISFADWYDEYSYWAEINEEGLPLKICKDAWEARDEEIKELEAENERLNKIIDDIEDWGVVSFDEGLLKLIKELKDGKSRN